MLVLVNLEAAVARRQRMLAQLDGVGFESVGVDGRGLAPASLDQLAQALVPGLRFDHARLSGAEIGCWLSHLQAWKMLLERQGCPACTVIEDDLQLHPNFAQISAVMSRQPLRELVFLGTSSRNLAARGRTQVAPGFNLHRPVGAVFNTWGYVIRRDACSRLFDRLDTVSWPIDHVLGGRISYLAPERVVIQPALVSEDPESGLQSQIEPHTFRLDRARWIEQARRRLLSSPVGDLYANLYRWL